MQRYMLVSRFNRIRMEDELTQYLSAFFLRRDIQKGNETPSNTPSKQHSEINKCYSRVSMSNAGPAGRRLSL